MTLRKLILFALFSLPALAGVEVSTKLDRENIVRGESFTLTISVVGPLRGIQAPAFPDLESLTLVGTSSSSNFSYINGESRNEKIFHYQLIARDTGPLEIPPIAVKVKKKTHYSKALKLKVHSSGQPSRPIAGEPGRRVSPERGQIFIRSWCDEEEVWVGEQLIHHFALYRDTRLRFRGTPQYEEPETGGFWKEALGDEISGFRKREGRDYAVTELRAALFPQESGTLQIGPATLRASIYDPRRDDFFSFGFGRAGGRDRVLQSEALEIRVLPLPEEGKPAGFLGTVAHNLRFHADIEPGPYEVGQPFTLTLRLSGQGNPRAFAAPKLSPGKSFREYESDLQSVQNVDAEGIYVEKVFTWVLVPQSEGRVEIPGIDYPWFNPESGKYEVARTPPLSLVVAPSSAPEAKPLVFSDLDRNRAEVLGRSIHHIRTVPLLAGDGQRFPRSAAFWTLLALPWPLLASAWIWRKRKDAMEGDLAGYRSRRAGRMARKHLRDAKKALSQGDSGNFTSALSLGLRNYLRDRLASYRNDEDSLNALAESGVSHEDCETFRSLLGDCDFARFAPGDREQLQGELLQRAELLLSRLEKTRKRSSLPLSVLLLLLLAFPVMADTEESMLEAAERYEAGQFSHAAAQWQDLADSGLEDSQLWYNLGNARFQEEKIGEAILSWRRALRLAPRDRMSRENLEIARARVLHELPPAEASISSKLWMGLRSILSPGEMALFALLFLWSLSILVLLLVLRRASWTRLRVPVWLFLLLFLLASLAMGKAEREDWGGRQAILLAPSVTLLSGPGEDFLSIVEIHEGSELEIRETRGEWMRIRMHGDLEGWLLSGTVERL